MDRRYALKIKFNSLAAEARIIRREERKARNRARRLKKLTKSEYKYHYECQESMHFHRTQKVRPMARATHIALGFLRGRTYRQIEQRARTEPNWGAVTDMIKEYGVIKTSDMSELAHQNRINELLELLANWKQEPEIEAGNNGDANEEFSADAHWLTDSECSVGTPTPVKSTSSEVSIN